MNNDVNVIYYQYTPSGRKLSEKNMTNGSANIDRYYHGPFTFISNTTDPAWVNTPHGRFVKNGSTWTNEIHLKDHLGNTRLAMLRSGSSASSYSIAQENFYYPFGMRITPLSTNPINLGTNKNRYMYNGKEFNDHMGLNWYDYGARFYDPQIARFHSIDPLTEKNHRNTPYSYAANSPIRFIDYMGLDTVDVFRNNDGIFQIGNVQMVEGNDVFRVNYGDETRTYTFSDGEYGNRLNMLYLENTGEGGYLLSVFHVSGGAYEDGRTGFAVTPGGRFSTVLNSERSIPPDTYVLQASPNGVLWVQPWVTSGQSVGNVWDRGIKFHYSGELPIESGHTLGCFVVASSYSKRGRSIVFNPRDSRNTSNWLNFNLGATSLKQETNIRGQTRVAASFNNTVLDFNLVIQAGYGTVTPHRYPWPSGSPFNREYKI